MKRTTIAKDFEAKQANPGGALDQTLGNEAPLGASGGASGADWSGNGIATDQFASKDELGELRQAVAMKVSMSLHNAQLGMLHTLWFTLSRETPQPCTFGSVRPTNAAVNSNVHEHAPPLIILCHVYSEQDKELRDIRDRMQDKEGELDTLRKAGKNLRERLDEKEVETRGIMDRVSPVCNVQGKGDFFFWCFVSLKFIAQNMHRLARSLSMPISRK